MVDIEQIGLIIGIILVIIIVGIIAFFSGASYRKHIAEAQIGTAEEKSRKIIDDAIKAGEAKKREVLLEAKEENIRVKNELDKEVRERRNELQQLEKRLLHKEENIDRKTVTLEQKEEQLQRKIDKADKVKEEAEALHQKQLEELERISGLTLTEAKQYLLQTIEEDVRHESAIMIKEIEAKAKLEADIKANEIITNAIQ